MLAVTIACPHCRQSLPSTAHRCTHCGGIVQDPPTRTLQHLNNTTDFASHYCEREEETLAGTELANYWIEQFLGEGGMARVFRARHLTLERPCALKILKSSDFASREVAAATFLAEARAAAALVHPHVVTIHNIGHDRGYHFIEMEFVEGRSLSTVLARQGSFDFAEATRLMVQIASALELAHRQGMIHRDIKPANVLMARDGTAKLADFGLAKRVQQLHVADGRVLTGTPNYMAPELFQGMPADMRSDVYAMGVTYFQLLSGRLPFHADSLQALMQWQSSNPPVDARNACPDLPDCAATIVQRCLASNPGDRYPDASTLLTELRAAYGSLRSLESLLRESLDGTDSILSGNANRFEVTVPLATGRRQTVVVEIASSAAVSDQVIRIASVCGRADERHFLRALELNANFPFGAVGIEPVGGVPHFVMTNVYPRATCDPEEVRHSVLGIAQHADDAEHWLSRDDVH